MKLKKDKNSDIKKTFKEKIETVERSFCSICGHIGEPIYTDLKDVLFGVGGLWNILQCLKCQLLWLTPYAIEESAHLLYKEYYTHQNLNNYFLTSTTFPSFPLNKKIKYSILSAYFGYKIPNISHPYKVLGYVLGALPGLRKKIEISTGSIHYANNAKLLDVGCGNGDFLLEMKFLGFNVYGIEIDDKAAQIARNHQLEVKTGHLRKNTFPQNYFDIIHTNNVIEHLPNTSEIIKICHSMLKPGGVLILKTCSNQSLAHTFFKESYRGLEVPRHYFVFSPLSLKKLGEKSGFTVIKNKTSFNQYIWFSSNKIKLKEKNPADPKSNRYISFVLYCFISIFIFFRPNRGDDILITLRK